tara:strand:+ start:188 stop:1075 length:888 start_codon:yes stop_codon:yes gene_type:complete
MSRNETRLGLGDMPSQDSTPAATTAAVGLGVPTSNTDAPNFSWSVPTEFVELPSQGIFYPPGHPLQDQKTVEIRYMTAKEEDILTSRSLLKEGIALDRMLQNLLVSKNINIKTLLVGDKNALLVAARRTGYGADYETNVTCPSCANTDEHSFDISEPATVDFNSAAAKHSISLSSDGLVKISLPMTKAVVTCRFLTSADEANLIKESERKEKRKLEATATTDAIRAFVVSVNDQDDPFSLEAFIQSMPARDARELRRVYSELVPNIDLTQNYECSNCGYDADLEVPLGLDFFWPR